ncbi:helix-turn-helix transcriptional regulator [Streptomyces racemochromogenes]|uniref:Helix-turn-helix transcriptional regulator n=1 Tax=Streptomyces racemochromogenes TaxID=67353 RepID=A0ABW7PBR2_9ACTN
MSTPPFSPAEARAARQRLGMTPAQVVAAMAQLGVDRPPEAVHAWEAGAVPPSEPELLALADALWCPVAVLMAVRPAALREHRLARGFTAERLALRIGMDPHAYARAEAEHRWPGTDRQTLLLADALGLPTEELLDVLDRDGELVGLLRQAVEGRWKAHVAQLAHLAQADERRVARALRALHREYTRFDERYMGHLVARNDDARLREIAADRAAWLRALPERFRSLTGAGPDPAAP